MKIVLTLILSFSSLTLFAQNGYIKLNNDSLLVGYLRFYTSVENGQRGLEFWRTKNDKAPRRIPKTDIEEYAIKKDTFKVLHQFKPFYDSKTYFELVDAKLKHRGKVNLFVIENYQNPSSVGTYTGGGLAPAVIDISLGNVAYLYILESVDTGFLRGIPSKKEKMKEALRDFFPDDYILSYHELKGEIKYKFIPDLVSRYNSR